MPGDLMEPLRKLEIGRILSRDILLAMCRQVRLKKVVES